MKTEQLIYTSTKEWKHFGSNSLSDKAQLVFVFGNRELLQQLHYIDYLSINYPNAQIIGCSTSGEICGTEIFNQHIVCTAVWFEKTTIKTTIKDITSIDNSYTAGVNVAKELLHEELQHVMIFSEGLNINGSELVKGINSTINNSITVTGGLAGDQDQFKETIVVYNNTINKNAVVAIGFYGSHIKTGFGSYGGWNSFGVDRLVTKSQNNVLYELDGQPALELYKKYLGKHVAGLPASALLFPLSIQLKKDNTSLIRTILSINEEDGSMVFAGDVPQGEYVRLMTSNNEKLIDGANQAADMALNSLNETNPDLAILISCVGRKLLLKQNIEEEIETVNEIFGKNTRLTGFYSYGELCPINQTENNCELHNQTMTITLFKEL